MAGIKKLSTPGTGRSRTRVTTTIDAPASMARPVTTATYGVMRAFVKTRCTIPLSAKRLATWSTHRSLAGNSAYEPLCSPSEG
jgi:hypothetical protein